MTKKFRLKLLVLFFCTPLIAYKENGSVEHKNGNISGYLNEISGELIEKTQILEHILDVKEGVYVDLGTGGDSIAHLLENIPDDLPVTIIGSDIDPSILEAIPQRHPEVMPYLNQMDTGKLRLLLLRMDATNMHNFSEGSVNGFNCSALVHEIFSYVPTKTSLDQFFIELSKVLKEDGVFIYRDPKWDDNPEQDCLVILKDKLAKFFTVIFLPRFLDRTFSERIDYKGQCIKPTLYERSYIRINFFHKNSNKTRKVSLEAFINTPISNIDFSKNISLEAPRGLISEIQRHYILFLKNIFITELVDKNFFDREIVNIENFPEQERIILKNFIHKRGINETLINNSCLSFIQDEKKRFFNVIENGFFAPIVDKEKAIEYCSYLYGKGINHNMIFVQGDHIWADAKIIVLLYQGAREGIFKHISEIPSSFPNQVFEWMKREGEEFYFYKTTDQFITYVGQVTKHYLKGTNKEGYLLCPINGSGIRPVSRNLYKSIIDNHMIVMDIDGNQQDIIFDKNIIHFKLTQRNDALKIYKEIIKNNKSKFPELTEWVENELR